jgi:hypothetical protein
VELPRTARKMIEVDLDATLPSGAPATVDAVELALCDHDGPTGATLWLAASSLVDGVAQVVLCGREAVDKSGALVLERPRAELWARPAGGAWSDAGFVDTVEGL